MGTRGIYGFVVDGVEKLGYNHFDSYPEHLGLNILRVLRQADLEKLGERARNLEVIKDEETEPTPEQIARVVRVIGIPGKDPVGWYWLLHETQGDINLTLDAGYLLDYSDFAEDSLFCEWGYVIDFEAGQLEVYRGFQEQAHEEGRFAGRGERRSNFYPIKLIASFQLSALPSEQQFLRACTVPES